METKQNSVSIPGFDCQNYIIYDGTLYYTEEDPYLRSSDLTGGNQKTVYDGSGLGFAADSVQFNIYDETIYVLEKSNAQKMGSLKKMNIDGSNVVDIAEDINWFNIVNGNVFLRYWDGKSKPDTELYTYNIAANTPIGQMVNFDAAIANAKPEVEMPQINEYIFADSSTRVLTDAEVNALDQNTARYALNEIYARRGRKFKDQELQNYFNGKSWYVGTIEPENFDENSLSAIEKENTKKLEIRKSGKMVNSTVKEEKNAEVREVIESFSLSMMEATNGEVDFEVLNDCIHIDKDMDYWYVVEGLDYINPRFAHKYLLMPSDRSVNQDEGDAFYSLYLEALEIYGKN